MRKKSQPVRGLFLGRFQPYHNGHDAVIRQMSKEVGELIIAVGSAQYSHTERDPFTAGERISMITRALADKSFEKYVLPVEDIEQNALYVAHMRRLTPAFDVVYSNNSLVVRLFEEAGIAVKQLPLVDRGQLWGTKIRELMVHDGRWRQYVPKPVCAVIDEIKGIERLRQIQQSDSLPQGITSSPGVSRRGESD